MGNVRKGTAMGGVLKGTALGGMQNNFLRQGTRMMGLSRMSGTESFNNSQLHSSMLEAMADGDTTDLKIMINTHIAKKLNKQDHVFQTQLKNVKTLAIQDAINFIKIQSEFIQKHLTKEHHKLVEQFIAFKGRTQERLD